MAVNHYSADSAPRSCSSLHLRPPKAGYPIPLEITRSSISIVEVVAPEPCVLAGDASAYVGHGGCYRRLTASPALHTKPAPNRSSLHQTPID